MKSSADGNTLGADNVSEPPAGPPKMPKMEEDEYKLQLTPPVDLKERIVWAVCLPLKAAAYYTMPNCRLEKWRSWFLVSFFLSMLWISIFSYVMVWMITVTGKIFSFEHSKHEQRNLCK